MLKKVIRLTGFTGLIALLVLLSGCEKGPQLTNPPVEAANTQQAEAVISQQDEEETPEAATAVISETPEAAETESPAADENYAPDALTAETSAGIEVCLDYADDDIVVFHGYFGVFVYDLNAGRITSAVDLMKTVGCNNINGSVIAAVDVNSDGKTVQMYLVGVEDEMTDMGLDPDVAWYLSTTDGVLSKGVYEKLKNPFQGLAPAGQTEATSFDGVRFADGMAFISLGGNMLGDLRYVRADRIWRLFDGYFD